MYTIVMLALIGIGLWLAVTGGLRRRSVRASAGVILAAGTAFFFWFMGFWGEMLWFEALGYTERFWSVFVVRVSAGVAGLILGGGFLYLMTPGYSSDKRLVRYAALALAAVVRWWFSASRSSPFPWCRPCSSGCGWSPTRLPLKRTTSPTTSG